MSVWLCLSLYVVCFAVSVSIRCLFGCVCVYTLSVLLCLCLYVVCLAVSESIRMSVWLCLSLYVCLFGCV